MTQHKMRGDIVEDFPEPEKPDFKIGNHWFYDETRNPDDPKPVFDKEYQ